MDKIEKFLRSLRKKEYEAILLVLLQVQKDFRKVPGIIKLTGTKNLYRVRVGNYRIIFKIEDKITKVIRITKRDDQTYKDL